MILVYNNGIKIKEVGKMEELAKQYKANLEKVRSENTSMVKATELMKKHRVRSVEMAFSIEAKKMMVA